MAGKSTYAPKVRADVEEIVGPDEFAYRLLPAEPEQAALRAGRIRDSGSRHGGD